MTILSASNCTQVVKRIAHLSNKLIIVIQDSRVIVCTLLFVRSRLNLIIRAYSCELIAITITICQICDEAFKIVNKWSGRTLFD